MQMKCGGRVVNHIHMCYTMCKRNFRHEFDYAVIDKNIDFHEIAPNLTY